MYFFSILLILNHPELLSADFFFSVRISYLSNLRLACM